MPKLQRTYIFPATSQIKDPDMKRYANKLTAFLDDTLRKIASIPFNQSERLSVADTGNANTKFTVTHALGRIPNGFIVVNRDAACSVYDDGTAWTSSEIYLKCDTANVAITLTVF